MSEKSQNEQSFINQERIEAEEEKVEKLEIKEVKTQSEIKELSGRSSSSSHGELEDTKGLIVEVYTDKGMYETLVLLAKYSREPKTEKELEPHQGPKVIWEITDIKLIDLSASHAATFDLTEPESKIYDQLEVAVQTHLIDEEGKLKI